MCKVNTQWSGSLMIGVTSVDPSRAVHLPSAIKLTTGTLVANGKKFVVNGNEVINVYVHFVTFFTVEII